MGASNRGAAPEGAPGGAAGHSGGAGHAGGGAGGQAGGHAHEGVSHLIKMANDIGHFFQAEDRREDAVVGIASHIRKFWSPRMREKLLQYVARPADPELPALDALAREAMERLAAAPAAIPAVPPGGDPGGDAG
jgi:formate dehydrogenase subunit delta